MSMTKGTPVSSQIIWFEGRVKELEAELDAERERADEFQISAQTWEGVATSLHAKNTKLRETLKPFARFQLWTDAYPDGPLSATTWDRRVDPEWIVRARAVLEETKDQSREHEVLGIGDFSQEDIASVQQAQTSVEAAAFNSELSETKKCEVNDFKSGWYLTILDICGKKYIRLPDWVSRVLDRCKGGRYE
jgi:hypothetical protein